MTREMPKPGMPSMLGQLSVLPPAVKATVGLAMLALGVGAVVMLGAGFFSLVLLTVFAMTGVPLTLQGFSEGRQQKVIRSELQRAHQEIDLLRLEIEQAQANKRGLERFLIDRNFTTVEARRWIALECDVVLPRTSLP